MAIANVNNLFGKCAPTIRTNIAECGSVTLCANVKPETAGDLDDIYTKDGEYRLLEHLFMSHFEIKACGAKQMSMRDFFIANAKVTRKGEINFTANDRALTKVVPFIMAEQKKPINNVFWRFTNGSASGGNLVGRVASASGIPADVRSFPVGSIMFLDGLSSGGYKTYTQYTVASATVSNDGTYINIVLTPQNTGSLFPTVSNPAPNLVTKGILRRGVINVGKAESYCDDEPAYRNDNLVPFWMQDTRWTSCNSSLYNEWLGLVLEGNPLYRERIYIPEKERMRQMGEAFEDKLFNTFWYQNPLNNHQNIYDYEQLPEITNYLSDTGLGVEGGRCVGRKANAVGVLPQLRECDRWYDAGGAPLNIYSIFDAIYQLRRVRAGIGSTAQNKIDVFMDNITAEQFEKAFIGYLGIRYSGKDRYDFMINGKNDDLGLAYRSFQLDGRNYGVTLNIITDWAFDDQISENYDAGQANAGRTMMFLDLTGIYMKVIESGKQINHTGDIKALAAVDPRFSCVIETETRDTTLNWLKFTTVVECPQASLVIDNFSDAVPVYDAATAPIGSHPNYTPGNVVSPYAV